MGRFFVWKLVIVGVLCGLSPLSFALATTSQPTTRI